MYNPFLGVSRGCAYQLRWASNSSACFKTLNRPSDYTTRREISGACVTSIHHQYELSDRDFVIPCLMIMHILAMYHNPEEHQFSPNYTVPYPIIAKRGRKFWAFHQLFTVPNCIGRIVYTARVARSIATKLHENEMCSCRVNVRCYF